MADGKTFHFFKIPPQDSWRDRADRAVHSVTAHPACALFLASSVAILGCLWFSNGDLWVMVPGAVFGIILGLSGWYFAPISRRTKAFWIVGTLIAFVGATELVYWHNHSVWWPFVPAQSSHERFRARLTDFYDQAGALQGEAEIAVNAQQTMEVWNNTRGLLFHAGCWIARNMGRTAAFKFVDDVGMVRIDKMHDAGAKLEIDFIQRMRNSLSDLIESPKWDPTGPNNAPDKTTLAANCPFNP